MEICDGNGIECAQRQEANRDKCTIPCEGIYADIWKEPTEIIDENTPEMRDLFIAYENYKNQFLDEPKYPSAMQGTA